jgi:hypothetical protein
MSDDNELSVLKEIRNWIKASSFLSVKTQLEVALPDTKSRSAYQLLDGNMSLDQVRITCKMSPNSLQALVERCVAMGLMEITDDKKRKRLFNLMDFGLVPNVK